MRGRGVRSVNPLDTLSTLIDAADGVLADMSLRRPSEPGLPRSVAFDECVLATRVGARIARQLPPASVERAVVVACSLALQERLHARVAQRRFG